jgi:hypothetical protein
MFASTIEPLIEEARQEVGISLSLVYERQAMLEEMRTRREELVSARTELRRTRETSRELRGLRIPA